MRLRAAAVLGLALASVLVSSAGAASAAPPHPKITVTPHTGLVDGQTVTATATGLPPGSGYTIDECAAGAAAAGNSDFARFFTLCGTNIVTVVTDANGSATATLTVTRTFATFSGSQRSCGGHGRRCVVLAGTFSNPPSPFVERSIHFAGWVTCHCGAVAGVWAQAPRTRAARRAN